MPLASAIDVFGGLRLLRRCGGGVMVPATLVVIIAGCASLPDRVAREQTGAAASNPAAVVSSDAPDGERLLALAAGNLDGARHLRRLADIEQAVTGQALIGGNRVELLVDGPAAFRAMFSAIAAAEDHVHLETYILADDEIGQRMADLLVERRAAGVEVAVIFDDFGSSATSDRYFDRLEAAGVKLFRFHPLSPVEDLRVWRLNQRNHRKILVVDGRVAFTGGMNISGVYARSSFSAPRGSPQDTDERWRDTQVRIEGPAVGEFQKLFIETWTRGDGIPPLGRREHFPRLSQTGDALVRVVQNVGGDDDYDIYESYLVVIANARRRLWITQAYFVPDARLLDALKDAARRGVDVRILLPGFTDAAMVLHASRAHYAELLAAGVRLYERQDALLHAKTAVVDGVWSTVGSSNFDYRSFLHNNEANAVIVGRDFGREMERLFVQDLQHSKAILPSEWRRRPLWARLQERLGLLFKYWL